jgi:AAA domain, putative AbiEii toxin, Type IV TA system
MARMNAAVVTSFGEPPHYQPFEVPQPNGTDEFIVDVLAVGLHPRVRSGAAGAHYTSSGTLPMIPGIDAVGQRPDGTRIYFVAADDVIGTMADKALAGARRSIVLPDDADIAKVAAAMNPAMSSWVALRRRVPIKPGQSRRYSSVSWRNCSVPVSSICVRFLMVTENLQCFVGLYELNDVRGRIECALGAVNLEDRARDLCGSLSKGLRQRVALARALLSDPAVLFLDEPTSGLDPVATREVHELIASLRERGVTIFLTTHRLEEAERLCDRVAVLRSSSSPRRWPPSSRRS